MTVRFTVRTLLIPCGALALLLAGCSGTPAPTDGDAVAEYVKCLHEHGLENAVVNPDGSVGYEFTEDDLDEDGVVSASSGDTSRVEQTCQAAVPAYTPPDENQR